MNGIITCVLIEMKGVSPILSAHPPKSTMDRKDGPHSNNPHVRKSSCGEIQHIGWAYERPNGKERGFVLPEHTTIIPGVRIWRTLC